MSYSQPEHCITVSKRLKYNKMQKGFTLIELLVTIAIIAILSAIILFSIIQYINKSKDAAISGNLSILVPAGEVYYDHNGVDGYGQGSNINGDISGNSFCGSSVTANSFSQITSTRYCNATTNAWAACAQEFTDESKAFCVDSRGIKKEILFSDCSSAITICPDN